MRAGDGGRPSAARPRGFAELNRDDLVRPVLHLPRHPVRLALFGIRTLVPAATLARTPRLGGGGSAVRRCRRPRVLAPEPPAVLGGRDGARLRLPRLRLAGRQGRLRRDHRRAGRDGDRARGADRDGNAGQLAGGSGRGRRRDLRPGPEGRRRDRRGPAAGARGPRLSPLQARAGRIQARPRGRGRGAVDGRDLPAGGDGARGGRSGRAGQRRGGGQPRADARAPARPRRPAVPRRPLAIRRRPPPGVGLRPCSGRIRRRRLRGDHRPGRALRSRIPRADRRQR